MTRTFPRLLVAAASLLALGWLVYLLAGDALAGALADRLRGAVRSATDGKIRDAEPFFLHRLRDGLVIATAVVGAWGLNRLLVPRISEWSYAWIPLGVLFFVEANVILAVMARTGLFWLGMYAGEAGGHDVTRFYVRQTIAADADADHLVGLIGSSQAGTQMDEDRINDALGDHLYAAQLNFPAAKPYSLLLLQDEFERAGVDTYVLYLSEVSFLRGATLEHLPLFSSLGGLRDFARLGGDASWDEDRVRNGWISSVVPAYRLRSPLSQRVLGKPERPDPLDGADAPEPGVVDGEIPAPDDLDEEVENIKGRDEGAVDVEDPAFIENLERRVELLVFGETVDFQYRALEAFARRADANGQALYLLPGTVHPALAERLPPDARPQMIAFLRDLGRRYERVHYVEEDRLPVLGPADFKDAAHGSKAGQATFTDGLIEVLREEGVAGVPSAESASSSPRAARPTDRTRRPTPRHEEAR